MKDDKRLKYIELIISDLDGTLLNNAGECGNENKKLINELKKKNVLFTFASGRIHSALIGFASELNIKIPIISLEGSLIKNNADGAILFESLVPEKYVGKALRYADKLLLNVALCHADAIYYTDSNSVIPQIMDKFGANYQAVDSYENFYKGTLEVAFAGDNKDNLKFVKDKLSFPYAFGLNISYFKSLTHNGIYYLEIRKHGTNKGKTSIKLLKKLKISPKNTAVIGDWYNDLSLFETDAYKVTLSNGIIELKRKADLVMEKDNDEDGVAEFLEMVLRAKAS